MGSIWALLAIVSNSFYTIWGNTKQKELGVSAMQLLLYQAPISAMMLSLAIPMDGLGDLLRYEVTFTTLWTITLSCAFAFGVNLSFFLLVGQTSPLTMNVVGYLKTALVFIGGFIFLSSEADAKTLFGVTLTLLGLLFYTRSKMAGVAPAPVQKESRLM
uniref:Uncharacterized protein TCIL3000_6_3380 n=1 Tax=Trypanosoma congolense (strain IL3000) TaxID=1068625 RepID=G0UNX5_TRYCI|nr:unnamed protein product [Trypanosoma congolense IL3000]